ncbi:unnamed protein product [Strongylus vulgaris]|uniref:Uncharacterized protein n=1 Tax=Strongylus vulgaris TaxID=40348 RepID=A0A3P7J0F5_STRVU|nr:unnamed protein product [Strongylus vulgaris]
MWIHLMRVAFATAVSTTRFTTPGDPFSSIRVSILSRVHILSKRPSGTWLSIAQLTTISVFLLGPHHSGCRWDEPKALWLHQASDKRSFSEEALNQCDMSPDARALREYAASQALQSVGI